MVLEHNNSIRDSKGSLNVSSNKVLEKVINYLIQCHVNIPQERSNDSGSSLLSTEEISSALASARFFVPLFESEDGLAGKVKLSIHFLLS